MCYCFFFFFFSSRRRHTRFDCDWSSDVCSSDLETLRDEGFDGEIVLLGAEPERPYERPPLSKGYLLGNDSRDSVYVHAADWYAENGVDLREGVTVTGIDRGAGPASGTVA